MSSRSELELNLDSAHIKAGVSGYQHPPTHRSDKAERHVAGAVAAFLEALLADDAAMERFVAQWASEEKSHVPAVYKARRAIMAAVAAVPEAGFRR